MVADGGREGAGVCGTSWLGWLSCWLGVGAGVCGTITVQHLMLNRNALFSHNGQVPCAAPCHRRAVCAARAAPRSPASFALLLPLLLVLRLFAVPPCWAVARAPSTWLQARKVRPCGSHGGCGLAAARRLARAHLTARTGDSSKPASI